MAIAKPPAAASRGWGRGTLEKGATKTRRALTGRNPLKRLKTRKRKIWILLPFPWIFLPQGFENASIGLENASPEGSC
jgi:hypothetical protein